MKTFPTSPVSLWQLIKNCYSGYWPILKNAWPFIFIIGILGALQSWVSEMGRWEAVVSSIIMLLLVVYFMGALIHYCNNILSGQNPDRKESLAVARNRYFPLLGVEIALLIIYLILGLVIVASLYYYPVVKFGIILFILAILFALFAIYLFFSFFMSVPVCVLEKRGVIESINTSAKVTKHEWWRVFTAFIGIFIPILVVLVILGIFAGIIVGNIFGVTNIDELSAGSWIDIISNFVVTVLLYPATLSVILHLYHDLRLRHPDVN